MWNRITLFFFLLLCSLFAAEVIVIPSISEDIKTEGKQIYNKECYACHRWSREFAGPAMGDNIRKYVSQKEELVRYLMNPTQKQPEKYPPMALDPLSQKDAQVISSWLFYLLDNPKDPNRPR